MVLIYDDMIPNSIFYLYINILDLVSVMVSVH